MLDCVYLCLRSLSDQLIHDDHMFCCMFVCFCSTWVWTHVLIYARLAFFFITRATSRHLDLELFFSNLQFLFVGKDRSFCSNLYSLLAELAVLVLAY